MTYTEIQSKLEDIGYVADKSIAISVAGAINQGLPLLLEGDPGVGKTSLATSVAKILDLPVIRVQFYEGLTYDKILYDYDYQKQLLTIEAMKSALETEMKDKTISEAQKIASEIDFYGKEYLIERPILRAFSGKEKAVLLLDEIDKSSEEIEYTLLEALDEYSITIPQFGCVKCPKEMRPIVFLTSNNYRELSDALRRRCGYLYINKKTKAEMKRIIISKLNVDNELADNIAYCIDSLSTLPIKQPPSVAEAVSWAEYLSSSGLEPTASVVEESLFMLVKNKRDYDVAMSNLSKISK